MNAQVFVTTYGLYNSGLQFASNKTGFWIDVDSYDHDEIFDHFVKQEQKHIDPLCDDVEIMHTDFDGFPDQFYCESGCDIEAIQQWQELNEQQQEIVDCLLDMGIVNDIKEAIEHLEDYYIFDGDREDYAIQYIEETTNTDNLCFLANYIDYDAIGRDMEYDGILIEISKNKMLVCL